VLASCPVNVLPPLIMNLSVCLAFMATLRSTCGHYIFVLFLSFFFSWPQQSQIGCLPYLYIWCGPSANLEIRSEMCCTRLAGNAGPKKSPKHSPSEHHGTTLSGYIFATKARINNQKKNLLNSNVSLTSSQYGELRSTSG